MLKDFILCVISCCFTIAVDELRFRVRQKNIKVKEIVDGFLKLRKENNNNDHVYELKILQSSGILLLKKEKYAEEVLKQIELIDKPIIIPNFIREKGILRGLKDALRNGIDIEDFREVQIQEIKNEIEKTH